MSGTSADGIDAVVAEIAGSGRQLRARVLAHTHRPFSPAMRRRILHLCLHGTVAEICELNFALGEHFARAALAAIRRAKRKPRDIAAIGSHGQTIHHLPNAQTPSTLQIGEPAVIAERTGITTVADFRVRDMAAGGGARRWCRMRIGRYLPTGRGRASGRKSAGPGTRHSS